MKAINMNGIKEIKKIRVKAKVLVPPFHRYYFKLNINGWSVIPTSGGTEYIKEFNYDSDRKNLLESIEDLKFILLASFLDDFAPRSIHDFEIEGLKKEDIESNIKIYSVFGNNQDKNITSVEVAKQAFYSSNDLFIMQKSMDPHYQPDIKQIRKWFDFFKKYKYLAININFIQESFILFSNYFQKLSFFETTTLLNGIILLISALEGIFLQGQDEHSSITFKFSLIGSIFYEKYANEEFLEKFIDNPRKFTQKGFREILKELYSIRSAIAHGDYKKLYKCKIWKKFLTLKNVAYDENDLQITLKNVSFALGLLEIHILAIVIGAEKNLLKGIKIIDDVTFS